MTLTKVTKRPVPCFYTSPAAADRRCCSTAFKVFYDWIISVRK